MIDVQFLSDTNIFVNLYHAYTDSTNLCEEYVKKYEKLGFVEPVHYEIKRTPNIYFKNKLSILDLYKQLSERYKIIYIDELDNLTKQTYIEEMNNFGYLDYTGKQKAENNIGEKATLLISHLLEIPIIHTDDYNFIEYVELNRNKYPDAELIDLNTVLQTLVSDDQERIKLNKNISKNSHDYNDKAEKQKMDKKMEELVNKFSKNRINTKNKND